MAKIKALVLLSGGLDSVYNLYQAHQDWPGQVATLYFDYGQRAERRELAAAKYFTQDLKVSLQTINISNLFSLDKSSLIAADNEIPTDAVNIDNLEASQASAKSVWVANRNGVFLNVGACLAESMGAELLIPGFNAEEAQTFPDNSVEYIAKMNECLKMSTSNGVQIHCFSQEMNKTEIVRKAVDLGVNLDRLWSCYHQGEEQCGRCESCQRLDRAIAGSNKYGN